MDNNQLKHIVLYAGGSTSGGIKSFLEKLYQQLVAKGIKVSFLLKGPGKYVNYLEDLNRDTYLLNYTKFSTSSFKLFSYNIPNFHKWIKNYILIKKNKKKIKLMLTSLDPDCILASDVGAVLTLGKSAKLLKIPLSICLHTIPNSNDIFSIRKKTVLYFMNRYCSKLFGVSDLCIINYLKGLKISYSIIHNATDPISINDDLRKEFRLKYNIPQKAIVIGTMSRISRERGIDFYVKAAIEFLKQKNSSTNVYFVIAGNSTDKDSYLNNVLNRINESTYRDKIIYTGFQRPEFVLSGIDVFCQTLIEGTESFGLSILEALSVGLPIIITDSGGILEVLHPELGARYKQDSEVELIQCFNKNLNTEYTTKQSNLAIEFSNKYKTIDEWGSNWISELNQMMNND